ncbi:glycoside hydrolase family 19 protein [Roseomonas sp. GC11]|uniref:glycoside hydrolase family 19 protein n=1 Tax=Roseomonas sp. GC11 TaxID=2950546 RepID=UPI00210A0D58|nr:glycoside hydrolase family 19 protein [Roseomonas sp. GC11]MCQ4160853.1 glycoside hydrolase family 19 protein [Roseomonas sp. GC11]
MGILSWVSPTAPTQTTAPADDRLPAALRAVGCAEPAGWDAALRPALARFGIDTAARRAAFLGQVAHESGRFSRLEENLVYTTAARLCAVWPNRFPTVASAQPFVRNPEALANRVYGARMGNVHPGDGWRFRGRGLKQLTGRENYTMFSAAVGMTVEAAAEWCLTREGAAMSAAWYWSWKNLNRYADVGDVRGATRVINGGTTGLAEREDLVDAAEDALLAGLPERLALVAAAEGAFA